MPLQHTLSAAPLAHQPHCRLTVTSTILMWSAMSSGPLLMPIMSHLLMSLLIRYAHIPSYFCFSFAFPTLPIHHYAPPLRRDHDRARSTIALTLSDRSRLFDGHMTYDSHVFTSILSVSNVPPLAVRPITSSRTAQSGTFYSFAICSHSCLPFIFNLPVFTFHHTTSLPKP